MKSMVSSLVFVFTPFLLSFVAAAPRDVFVPKVLTPKANDVWQTGTVQTVTWDVSHPPEHITNTEGRIILVWGGKLDLDNPLATGLDIRAGSAEVMVPNTVEDGDDYQVIVFGDSGNTSGKFRITH